MLPFPGVQRVLGPLDVLIRQIDAFSSFSTFGINTIYDTRCSIEKTAANLNYRC